MPTEVTNYSIEMLWDCPNKHSGQLGRNLKCQICGYRKKESDEYYNPDDISIEKRVDEKLEVLAKAGPNWSCKYCGCSTRNTSGDCSHCGGVKPIVKKEETKKIVSEEPLPQKPSFVKRILNFFKRIAKYLVSIFVFFVLAFAFYRLTKYMMRPHIGKLVSVEIACEQIHEELIEEHHEGFDVPREAYQVSNLGLRFHHNVQRVIGSHDERYSERVVCGQDCHPIPVTCSTTPVTCYTTQKSCSNKCTSAKNGFANCTQTCTGGDRVCSGGQRVCTGGGNSCEKRYCDEERHRTVNDYGTFPVTQDYFSWKIKVWKNGRKVRKTLDSCSETCEDQANADEHLVSSKKEQVLVMAEDGSQKNYNTTRCENLEVGSTYEFTDSFGAKDFKKQ